MSLTSYLHDVYSLDTLDKRFTATSSRPHDAGRKLANVRARRASWEDARSRSSESSTGASPSRWRTPEFFLYYLVFLICVPLMFKAGIDASLPSHPNYKNYKHLLSNGWIPGRKLDNSDQQYSSFRSNIPYLLILFVVHPPLRKLYDRYFPVKPASTATPFSNPNGSIYTSQAPAADARLKQRVAYDLVFALLLICILHGFSIVKILIILSVDYLIATKLPRSYVVPMTWIYNVFVLFANELCKGYSYTSIANVTLPFTVWDPNSNWGTFCDERSGLIPRWEVLFNITILRLISFNMDCYWSGGREGGATLLEKQLDPSNLTERDRVSIPASRDDYSFRNYLAYALYSPLYLAGPILTFNEYISQARYPPRSVSRRRTIQYGLRFLVCLLTMELVLHYIYAVAISHAPKPAWSSYSPLQLSMLGFFHLHIIWLKLLLPWRFFRLWALADGVDPPENMVRCMSNNYSALAFWRGWHRSYNRWVVRYIFVPLGGSGRGSSGGGGEKGRLGCISMVRTVVNYLAVFTFVALWHDIQLRLLMWGWLVTLFFLPEVLATLAFPARKWQHRPNAYRAICGVGAVGNILMMMTANLVGFAVGLDGLKGLVQGILGSYSGLFFLVVACAALFVGVQVMFEVREEELRHGVRMKC